jgi:HAMP domain-containing protein
MKLTLKFNLIFVVIFGLGLIATGLIANEFLETSARDRVLEQARLVMETAASTRTYTAERIRPILEKLQTTNNVFYPESVPAFSAIRVLGYLHNSLPDYIYREATLNPTNPADRAVDWEADLINVFRNDPGRKSFDGVRDTPTGRSLYLARPMRAGTACMPCHSTPEAAPAGMIRIYGRDNGFGWKVGDVVAAQIVTVPMSIPITAARKALWRLMEWLAGVAVLSLVLLNVLLVFAVIRPVRRLSAAANEISTGNMDVPELHVRGKDEISVLADSFNRMHRSLARAMKMLEE